MGLTVFVDGKKEWKREHPEGVVHDRGWFLRKLMPKLDHLPLSAIANVTGLSLAACSRYLTGARVPHPRHWEALRKLLSRDARFAGAGAFQWRTHPLICSASGGTADENPGSRSLRFEY